MQFSTIGRPTTLNSFSCDIVSHATWSNVNIVSGCPVQLNAFELSCIKHLF
uniref:Uncharacterized protein n=1 Tax=Arundo donax TaxID=35708 RepID=A0A0A9CWC1_ARUDO